MIVVLYNFEKIFSDSLIVNQIDFATRDEILEEIFSKWIKVLFTHTYQWGYQTIFSTDLSE